MYTNDKFVKEWLASNTHTGTSRKRRKRGSHYRRASNAISVTSNFEESNLLSKVSKSSRSSKFSIARSYTRISNIGKSSRYKRPKPKIFLEEPSYYGTEIPAIKVVHSDNYSSHDSNKTY